MSVIQQLLPAEKTVSLEELAAQVLRTLAAPIGVAAPEAITFCTSLSHALTTDTRARAFASLQALGFWLRPSAVIGMVQNNLLAPDTVVRMPRGVVLQFPPAQLVVLFGYMAALSLLSGNVTLVRLPGEEETPLQSILLTLISETLSIAHEAVREKLILLRYPHDDAISSALSALCDARMVWGDDATIAHMRTIPLAAAARELSFGDRFSAAVLDATHYAALGETQKQQIVHALYNDIYLFDQRACASPRLIVWIGNEEKAALASGDFYRRLASYAQDCFAHMGAPSRCAKLGEAKDVERPPQAVAQIYNGALTVLNLSSWADLSGYKGLKGCGFLMSARLDKLRDLAALADRQDQTLAVWGFGPDEVLAFVSLCGGRGFDRIVPIGQALSFDPVWDGASLFDTLTRFVQVTV